MMDNNLLYTKSLKDQVYEFLRREIQNQNLAPGSAININSFCQKLGVSKTPLREALIQLEMEDFVTIKPRKGIFVNPLTQDNIEEYYQIIGALESSALAAGFNNITPAKIREMKALNQAMTKEIGKDNFDKFYELNLRFHSIYVSACQNKLLIKILDNLKKRLYDFPRRSTWIKNWEMESIDLHGELVRLLENKELQKACLLLTDVVWVFDSQKDYITKYYSFNPDQP
jgi:DNA-binding GntR family transcriptional regulator